MEDKNREEIDKMHKGLGRIGNKAKLFMNKKEMLERKMHKKRNHQKIKTNGKKKNYE